MKLILTKDHLLKSEGLIVGRCEENNVETLDITIFDKSLHEKNAYLEFQLNDGSKVSTEILSIVDGVLNYTIPNSLLKEEGDLKVQVVFREGNNLAWKSSTLKLMVMPSINASESIEEDNPDFISKAQAVLDECERVSKAYDEAEQERVKNENIRIENENARIKAESQRNVRLDELETNKVDKVEGKGLSTNDYTNDEKEFLHLMMAESSYVGYGVVGSMIINE